MAQMEKIKFLSEVSVGNAPIDSYDSGYLRNIASGVFAPGEDITTSGSTTYEWYHDALEGSNQLSMGAGVSQDVRVWDIATSKIVNCKLFIQGALYFTEWYRSFLFWAANGGSAITCKDSTVEQYVKQLDNDSGNVHTYEVTIPADCSHIYIQTKLNSSFNVSLQPIANNGDIYIQYE